MLISAVPAVALLLLFTMATAQTVRLVGGPSPQEGRLEVYYNGRWGTVCDDYFNDAAARVVCYMFGHGHSGRFTGNRYGAGSGTIWLDNVQCSGTETSIADCSRNSWGSHDCGHSEDVSVSCPKVRLVGGPSSQEGRLEVYHNDTWGTVCGDGFTDAAAAVVCYSLGYGYVGAYNNRHGAGNGTIWLDDVQCNGTETDIADCSHRSWGSHECSHSEDVSILCPAARLVGGPSPREGRLEVYYNGKWGTVCDDYFNDAGARVVCYMFGLGHTGRFIGNRYGAGSGRIWLDDVRCSGTETSIADCSHRGWGSHSCGHSEDVSVSCPIVRLVGGSTPQQGRLEVLYNDTWGTVCDDGFTDAAASVVCYSLGYGYAGAYNNRYGAGSGPIWLDDVECNGTETSIVDCQHNDWGSHNCSHSEDVSVLCPAARLVGGPSPREGRLEVYYNGRWGTVCNDYFNHAAARVVCCMLGYGGTGRFISNRYGAGSGTIWLDNVRCNGTETTFAECSHRNWGSHNCWHSKDVSVSCPGVRLVGGSSTQEGRLEVYHNSNWGTVCGKGFSDAASGVVCYSLGYGHAGAYNNRYGAGNGTIWLDDVHCNGTETNIADCEVSDWGSHNCSHSEDVSVLCPAARLVGGPIPREGRLEVYYDGRWGTVCDYYYYYFNDAAARVVCYMLGHGHIGRFIGNRYGAGSGTIWLDEVRCNGTETNIAECSHRDWGSHYCWHSKDVSVSCPGVRLVGGSSTQEGRLEVYHNNIWGTVCGKGFSDAASGVVCYSLGYGHVGAYNNRYGAGNGTIWLDDVDCNGTEINIADCEHNDWGSHSCIHSEDVSVSCPGMRLVGGPSSQEGRLEVYHNDTWGTVCENGFTNAAASVICYMLGYGFSGQIIGNRYGASSGMIWLDDVRCSGTETSIADCQHRDWGSHNCSQSEYVSVSCRGVRLVGGQSPYEGRVEVYYNNSWGTVCDDYFNDAAARVVCYMLGLGRTGWFIGSRYGAGSGTIWLDNVQCSGTEPSIADCSHSSWGSHICGHSDDVSVSCPTVRLVGGSSSEEGRLEVYHNGTWGTVCDDGFTDAAASVVCQMLKYRHGGAYINNRYGAGNGTIWLDDVRCSGTETNIADCEHRDWGSHNCRHSQDVSVLCTRLRLVGGRSSQEGRVEVYYNGTWGTVCGDGFTDAAASVVCYVLGYGYSGVYVHNRYGAGSSLRPIWLDDVRCSGTETSITSCQHRSWGSHNCGHSESVSVSCVTARLTGGPGSHQGRLEIYYNGRWGIVCDDHFDNAAAGVVCYMLGYGRNGRFIGNLYSARWSTSFWLDDVRCRGTETIETSITYCQHNGWGRHNCGSDEDVSLLCPKVRLSGSLSPREGRVEVYRNGAWETVCGRYFDDAAASVVCYMLGYGHVGHVADNRYGAGNGTSWLNYLRCSGTETSIEDCHVSWGSYNCEGVSVSCFTVRLVGGSASKGRIEVYLNGTWATVCDKRVTNAAARVVCYSLGYGHVGRFIGNSYGAGSGQILLENYYCNGSESHIIHCPRSGWGRRNCSHDDDVSISCVADSAEAIALVGGGNPRVGRLEVFHAYKWGTVCGDRFTDTSARVVCYSLGFGYIGRKVDINLYGVGDGLIWLNTVMCHGAEEHIGECSHSDWGVHNCTHHQDVAVSCYSTSVTPVRLVGGSNSSGRLEVLHNGVWGTVCGDYFTVTEARVVCGMLGYVSGNKVGNSNYTTSDGPIWLDGMQCNGTETDIAECPHNGWGVHNCQHREDVAVSCARVQVRLNGGRDPREGRLEVFYDSVWGTLCTDGFDNAAARVVCNMLGFGYIGRTIDNTYSYDPGPSRLKGVRCVGTEQYIGDCSRLSSCSGNQKDVVSLSCLTDGAVALFGGESPREGRLEVYHNGRWGTVCDDRFTDAAARVVCYSLGFGYVGQEMNVDNYGIGKGDIWLDDMHCYGMERHISECSHGGWGVHNCEHNEDVAVSCSDNSSAARVMSTLSSMSRISPTTVSSTATTSPLTATVTSATTTPSRTSSVTSITTMTSSETQTLTRTTMTPSPTSFATPATMTSSSSSSLTSSEVTSSPTSFVTTATMTSSSMSSVTSTKMKSSPTSAVTSITMSPSPAPSVTPATVTSPSTSSVTSTKVTSSPTSAVTSITMTPYPTKSVTPAIITSSSRSFVTSTEVTSSPISAVTSTITPSPTSSATPATMTSSSTSSLTSTKVTSFPSSPTSSVTSTTMTPSPTLKISSTVSTSPSTSTTRSTAAIQSDSNDDGPDITLIIIVAIVVGGLFLITCVIVVGLVIVHSRKTPRQDRTQVTMTPMPVTASNYDLLDNTAKYENRANDSQASNNNDYSDVQQSPASAGGAVGGAAGEDHEPFARYDSLPDDDSVLYGNSRL